MFNNVEEKLKGFAKFNFVAVIIFAAVGFFALMSGLKYADGGETLLYVMTFAIVIYSLFAVCWFMYAFAEITESVKETNKALQLTFERNIAEAEERRREEAEARDEEAKAEEEKAKTEAEAAEAARKKRFNDYWEAHAEEKAALLAKRAEAQNALNSISSLATEERTKLQNIINAIDAELTKDR